MSSTVVPKHPDFIADPHAFYRTFRSNAPVHWSHSLRGWVVTRHDLVSSVLLDQRFSVEKHTPFVAHMSGQMREKIEIVTGVLEIGWFFATRRSIKGCVEHSRSIFRRRRWSGCDHA